MLIPNIKDCRQLNCYYIRNRSGRAAGCDVGDEGCFDDKTFCCLLCKKATTGLCLETAKRCDVKDDIRLLMFKRKYAEIMR